jgi:uncharacterized membrane protein YkvI
VREYKLTALMAATSFLLCSGLMTNNRQMYWMASVLGALMLGAYLLVRPWRATESPCNATVPPN